MTSDLAPAVERAARRAVRESGTPVMIAVSGGLDSMALLHAIWRAAPKQIAAIATFDHRTGPAASQAVAHVRQAARALGLLFLTGRATDVLDLREGREAAWRDARYAFLRCEAERLGARVVTAHTEDDQVETVLMRVMRGSGARGLAALYAESEFVRPFLGIRRATLEAYVTGAGVTWVEDPSNQSRSHLRNRVRHDLLPALRRVTPDFDAQLLVLARRAAVLRSDVEAYVDSCLRVATADSGALEVGARELDGLNCDSLMVVWGALASRVGLSLDRRGTRRIGEFTMKQPRAGWIPLAGGWQLEARRGLYRLYSSGSRQQETGNRQQETGNRS